MRIVSVSVSSIRYRSPVGRDDDGMVSVGVESDALAVAIRIGTDEGLTGIYIEDDVMVVDQLRADPGIVDDIVGPAMLGEDPYHRERIWQRLARLQRLHLTRLHDRIIAVFDVALWDLLGKAAQQPVHRLIGTFRDTVPAYASTMMGESRGPLATPEGFAEFAAQCQERGFQAFKLHTWAPLMTGEVDWHRDAEACRAVRDRVGTGMELMLDPWHFYDRQDALRLGRAIEELDFFWYEEPMFEGSLDSYVWLCDQLRIPLTGPEIMTGRMQTRADWIVRGACDIARAGILDIGGITPMLKMSALCESLGVPLTLHLGGVASLHVLATMPINGWYFERGMLHPNVDPDLAPPWLHEPIEVMSRDGLMAIPQGPGLGYQLDEDFLAANEEVLCAATTPAT